MADSDTETPVNPHDLILRSDVETVLQKDKGADAVLETFEIKDFTSKGDNNACAVTSVVVQYEKDGKHHEITYVAKVNPCRKQAPDFDIMMDDIFGKETEFYSQMVPLLDAELKRAGEKGLRVPKYFHSVDVFNKQVVYLEDLRRLGYKMFNRQKTLDKPHIDLIIKELARLHAASALLMNNGEFQAKEYEEKQIKLQEKFDDFIKQNTKFNILQTSIGNAAKLIGQVPGYECACDFLVSLKDDINKTFSDLTKAEEPFKAISHGDCWNNNFLFRYSTDGTPLECRILDLQGTRVGSPALDLNHVIYTSLDGDFRRAELPDLLTNYYATFASVFANTGVPMRFTFPQLQKEFQAKKLFGLILGVMIVPAILLNPEDAPDMTELTKPGVDMKEAIQEFLEKLNKLTLESPSLQPRLLSLFDEMKESGMFYGTANVSRMIQRYNSIGSDE